MPEPQPISWGSISQGMPDLSTKMMPVRRGAVRHARSTTLGLGRLGRQQRGDEGPQLVADKRFGHAPGLPCPHPVLIGALSAGAKRPAGTACTWVRDPRRPRAPPASWRADADRAPRCPLCRRRGRALLVAAPNRLPSTMASPARRDPAVARLRSMLRTCCAPRTAPSPAFPPVPIEGLPSLHIPSPS